MSDYTPRYNSNGIRGNPHYYSSNPFYNAGYGMPNCTCYAWGRFWEIADPNNEYIHRPTLSTGNAEDWYPHTSDGYSRGSTPALGAIACYADGNFSGLGHVCVVEYIDYDNQKCRVSESAYHGYFFRSSHWISYSGAYGYGGYHFQGFIYNPYAGDTPGPPGPGPLSEGKRWWYFKKQIKTRKELIFPIEKKGLITSW